LRFQSVIHETIRPALYTLLERDVAARVVESPYSIMHYGYEGDLTRKHHRNLNMLRRAIADNPKRVYLRHALGECLLGLGEVDAAEQAWREGLALVRAGTDEPGVVLIYANLISLHLGDNCIELDDFDLLLDEACSTFAWDPMILWCNARRQLERGSIAAAVQALKVLEALGPDGPQGTELGYDTRLFGEFAWALLGSCELARGASNEAAGYFERALAGNPGNVELRTKYQLAKSRMAQRPAQSKPA
jgi:tetratricopeptide (TPR) repeat protein